MKKMLKLGDLTLKNYDLYNDNKSKVNFGSGGWNGVVVFKDSSTGTLVVNRTSKLSSYLKSICFDKIKSGVFGKEVSVMCYMHTEVFYHECSLREIRELQNYLRKEVTKIKKLSPQKELPLELSPFLNDKPHQLINAFVSNVKEFKPFEASNPIGITYVDHLGYRCTMFVQASTKDAGEHLVRLLNENAVNLGNMTIIDDTIKKVKLEDFAKQHKLVLHIKERKPSDMGSRWKEELRYFVSFDDIDIKDGPTMRSGYGNGKTVAEAIENYAKEISCQKLVYRWNKPLERKDFKSPHLYV